MSAAARSILAYSIYVFGLGATLALLCDFVVAAEGKPQVTMNA